jgi:hypothetical protein
MDADVTRVIMDVQEAYHAWRQTILRRMQDHALPPDGRMRMGGFTYYQQPDMQLRAIAEQRERQHQADMRLFEVIVGQPHHTDIWFGRGYVWPYESSESDRTGPFFWTRYSLQTTRRCGFVPNPPSTYHTDRQPIVTLNDAYWQRDITRCYGMEIKHTRFYEDDFHTAFEATGTTWDNVCDDCRCLIDADPHRRPPDRALPGGEEHLPQPFVCEGCRFILQHTQMMRYCTTSHRCWCGPWWTHDAFGIFRYISGNGRTLAEHDLMSNSLYRHPSDARRMQALHCVDSDMCMVFYKLTALVAYWAGPSIPPQIHPIWYAVGQCMYLTPSRTTDAIISQQWDRMRYVENHWEALGWSMQLNCQGLVCVMSAMTRGMRYWPRYVRRRKNWMKLLMLRLPECLAEKVFDLYCAICCAPGEFSPMKLRKRLA